MKYLVSKMQPHIAALTHISLDVTQPALYLTANNGQKYLIGRIGEGFQRSLAQTKTKTTKLSGLFLTGQIQWESVSGVPGMLLSLADRETSVGTLHCGPGKPLQKTTKMIKSWDNFTFHKPLSVVAVSETYSDDNVEISPITILDSGSYKINMKPTRGKFMVEKAKMLGVPRGSAYSKLSNGQSIQIPGTDREVHPHEVLGPAPIPAMLLVLDLPEMTHVEEAVTKFASFKESVADSNSDLRAVFFLFGDNVDLKVSTVTRLMDLVSGPNTKCFVSHPRTSPNFNTLTALAEFQGIFRQEFPNHFSPLFSQPALEELPFPGAEVLRALDGVGVEPKELTNEYSTNRPKKQKTDNQRVELVIDETVSAGLKVTQASELMEPEVVTLGTGASAPSKYRNVSSTMVRTADGTIILDAGEGTSNTLGRMYGPNGRDQILDDLKMLYVSHMHADHHLGGLQVIRDWIHRRKQTKNDGKKLLLAAPKFFHSFVHEWAELDECTEDLGIYVTTVDLEDVCFGHRYSTPEFRDEASIKQAIVTSGMDTGDVQISTCIAKHCTYAYNASFTFKSGFKVSYSGDSRPNKFFADTIGQGSDLLVHEATHSNDLQEEAIKKRHSTIAEALGVSSMMKARNTVLTHISQRYPRLPTLDGELLPVSGYAYFGFDFMHTKLSEIEGIQQMIPKMSMLLESLSEEDESAS